MLEAHITQGKQLFSGDIDLKGEWQLADLGEAKKHSQQGN